MLNKDQLLLAVDDAKKAFDALPSLGEVTTARLHEETKLEMTYVPMPLRVLDCL